MIRSKRMIYPVVLLTAALLAACSGGGGGDEGGGGGDSCTLDSECTASQFCRYEDLSCGAVAGAQGVCREKPAFDCNNPPADAALDVGTPIVGPVCSCARIEFKSECWASAAAQSVAAAGGCP